MYKKIMDYFSKHPAYSGIVHFIGGVGIGILIARPVAGTHPLRWGITLLIIAILGHVYALYMKK